MKMSKKMLSIILALVMTITCVIPVFADTYATSGTCGKNVTWSYDTSTYTLTISGTGAMEDYSQDNRPWEHLVSYKDEVYDSYGDYYYTELTGIQKVIIESGVASISEYAFYDCDYITDVTVADTVKFIGAHAFLSCNSLKNIDIPNSVKFIGDYAFCDCDALTSLTIPDSVMSIGNGAFCGCDGFTLFVIPDGVVSLGSNLFESCSNLKSVTIGDSVTLIDSYAFYDCTSLESVTIGDSVTSIGRYAFYNCTSLTSITIPDSVTSIGYSVFFNCTSLESVTIPDSVTSIGGAVFYNCISLKSVDLSNNVSSLNYAVVGYDQYYGFFENCISLEYVNLSNSLNIIDDYSFRGCTNLKDITIPKNVISIGYQAFDHCSQLTSITIPDSVKRIESYAFSGCTNLQTVAIGKGVEYMDSRCLFEDEYNYFGQYGYAFSNCFSLESITVNEENMYYSSDDYGVLFNKDKTKLYVYPSGNERTNYVFPDTVTTVSNKAFTNAKNLIDISFSDSLRVLGYNISNTESSFMDGFLPTEYYGYVFQNCSSLKSITIPNGVSKINEYTFDGCTSLEKITIPDSVKKIDAYAFKDCLELSDVYYTDTEENWKKIDINSHNEWLIVADKHFEKEHSHSFGEWLSTEAGCGETLEERTCILCEEIESKGLEGSHEFGEWKHYSGTCGETGTEYRQCIYCDKHEYQDVVSVSHDWTLWKTTIYPTYDTMGEKTRKCQICGEIETEEIPVNERPRGDVNGDGNITAVDARIVLQYVAGLRALTKEETIKADISRDNVVSVIDVRAILQVVAGLLESSNDIEFTPTTSTIKAPNIVLSSNFKNVNIGDVITVTVTLPKKSSISGITADICFDSSTYKPLEMKSGDFNATVNYNFDDGKSRFTTATATTFEQEGILCTLKLEVLKTTNTNISLDVVEAIDADYNFVSITADDIVFCFEHQYDEWVLVKESTCFENGFERGVCNICGAVHERIIPLAEHRYEQHTKNPTCINIGENWEACSVCGDIINKTTIPATGHNYTWYTISVVTCETDGVMLGECTVCGATDVKATLKTGHNIVDGVCQNCGYTENGENNNTNTDDNENVDNEDNNNQEVNDPSENCSCNCHKSGISNFFFKIGLFFQKIFGSNKTCSCGVAHY